MNDARRLTAVAIAFCVVLATAATAVAADPGPAETAGPDPATDAGGPAAASDESPVIVSVFEREPILFSPDGPPSPPSPGVTLEENGRVIARTVQIDPPARPHRIIARVTTEPVPKDELSVSDPWDRAGDVRLSLPGEPDLEVVKFVTAYGGVTEHEADVTQLAPVLRGACTFKGFVDTWLSPAWKMSLEIEFRPAEDWELLDTNSTPSAADWVMPVLFEQDATAEDLGERGYDVEVEVPGDLSRVALCYLTSGHCTDGRDEDEFVSKDNVIAVDGVVVERFRPWRDDCRRFRDVNPYTRRWSDGWWSSDYSRSGWCPGDQVPPYRFDLTDHLAPGPHVMTFNVEKVRPREGEHYGYWRLSAYLLGWRSD